MNTIPIIYQNDEIIIINKRAGLSVQGGVNISSSVDTLLAKQVGYPVFLVHRLDKETSGLMIVAKNSKSANKWTKAFQNGEVEKVYEALCIGKFFKKSGTITDDIIQHGVKKSAKTLFNVIEESVIKISCSEEIVLSKVSVKILTGRMHQIRIHFAKVGNPIVADDKHGNFKMNKILRKIGFKKMQLFCVSLSFWENGKLKKVILPNESVQDVEHNSVC
ncbi:MAG: RNA pseudouridine synthase [Treponema sp.]|nr:RNA pseudouridine synthase [Treponema sp.]